VETDVETLKRAKTEVEKEETVKEGEEKTARRREASVKDSGVSTPPETEAEVVDDETAAVEQKMVATEVEKGRPRRATKGKKVVLAESSSED